MKKQIVIGIGIAARVTLPASPDTRGSYYVPIHRGLKAEDGV